jgi:hypothetical protein
VLATSSSVADSSERTETGPAILLFKDVLDYKGRHREVMGGRGWTELFVLDEAVRSPPGIARASSVAARPARRNQVRKRLSAGGRRI